MDEVGIFRGGLLVGQEGWALDGELYVLRCLEGDSRTGDVDLLGHVLEGTNMVVEFLEGARDMVGGKKNIILFGGGEDGKGLHCFEEEGFVLRGAVETDEFIRAQWLLGGNWEDKQEEKYEGKEREKVGWHWWLVLYVIIVIDRG